MIWVAGLVRQSEPAEAIFEPGSDCGMPYAPEEGFCACGFQLLSRCQSESRQVHWSEPQPRAASSSCAIERGSVPE